MNTEQENLQSLIEDIEYTTEDLIGLRNQYNDAKAALSEAEAYLKACQEELAELEPAEVPYGGVLAWH